MTREEKVEKKKRNRSIRISKRIRKNNEYMAIARSANCDSISWGRRRSKGRVYQCDMGYGDCEARGYCNGDC